MSKKSALIVFFLSLLTLHVSANKEDKVQSGIEQPGNRDSIDYYLSQSELLIDSLPEKSLLNAEKAKKLSATINNKERYAYASRLLGEAKLKLQSYYQAEKQLLTALDFYDKTRRDAIIADINFSLGVTRYHLGKNLQALNNYKKASALYDKTNDEQKFANSLQCIGLTYNSLNQLIKAEEYFYKSLAINKAINNNKNIAELYQNLGIVCFKQKNDSLALNYYNMAIMFYKKEHNLKGIGINYTNIGLIYLRNKNFVLAQDNLTTANTYFIKSDYITGQMWALNNMGASLASLGKFNEAEARFHQSLDFAIKTSSVEGRLTNYLDLSKYYEQTGNLSQSLAYQKLHSTLRDSSLVEENTQKLNELESLYLLESQEREFAEAEIDSKAITTKYSAAISLVVVVLIASLLIFAVYTQKRKAENRLEEHKRSLNKLIEERTDELQHQISERKTAEESDKLKSAFLANMSHELRTPMNAIIAFSNFLREPDVTDNQKDEYLNHIGSAGDTLLSLIDDIIDIAKIESQQLKLFIQPTNINLLLLELHKIYTEIRNKKNERNVDFKLNIENTYNYIINTDSKRLKQVLSNLLENAFKYTKKGKIEIGFETTDNSVSFYVSDTGVGIPKDKHEVIFDRFSQLRYVNDSRTSNGTGLGLAICKNLIKLLGGKIWVDSEEGKGSKFIIRIPVESIKKQVNTVFTEKKTKNSIPIQSIYDWNDLTILVAEDEDLNYKVLDTCLKRTKAHIIRARDGASAVEICKTQKVDVVLMDIQMPGMNGYEATKEIKRFNNRTPVIAQTSFAMIGEKERCLQAGCDDFVTKPLNIESLLQKIECHVFSYVRQII